MAGATKSRSRRAKSGKPAPSTGTRKGKPAAPKAKPRKQPKPPPPSEPVRPDAPRLRASPPPLDLDVDPAVLEFIGAIEAYRIEHQRPFPTWSEVLHVVRQLGYRKP